MNTRPNRHNTKRHSAAVTTDALRRSSVSHLLVMILVMTLCIISAVPAIGGADVYASSLSASGTIQADDGAVLRSKTTTESQEKGILPNGTEVRIIREIFKKNGEAGADTRWYLVKVNGNKGYVRSDLVTNVSYPSTQAYMKNMANFRTGPSVRFTKLGRLRKGTPLIVHGEARVTGKRIWYMAEVDGQICYISSRYITFDTPASAVQETPAAAAPAEPAAPVTETAAAPAADPAPAQTAAQEPAQAQAQAAAQEPAQAQAAAQQPAQAAAETAPASSGTVSINISGATQPSSLAPGKGFAVKGSISSSAPITKVVAGVTDLNGNWCLQASSDVNATTFELARIDAQLRFGTLTKGSYRYRVDVYVGSTCYNKINSDFQVLGNEIAANLMANPTNGSGAWIVGTFDTSNCSRLFAVKGTKKAQVPQGMTINGDRYYLVYGMSGGQAVVTYSSSGQKLAEKNFPFNMGHPNGITWDPHTGLCYIFRGNMKKCYTWNPANDTFGSAKTPYSSSGIAYDSTTGLLYATSQTGVREYSADGSFSHRRLFSRCRHNGKTYIQDCGASNGFIFHCISGANKHKTNYLDVYREADGKYLGTIRINIDEAESAVVGPDGYVQILCNTTNNTDYIWRTPLNVKELH